MPDGRRQTAARSAGPASIAWRRRFHLSSPQSTLDRAELMAVGYVNRVAPAVTMATSSATIFCTLRLPITTNSPRREPRDQATAHELPQYRSDDDDPRCLTNRGRVTH